MKWEHWRHYSSITIATVVIWSIRERHIFDSLSPCRNSSKIFSGIGSVRLRTPNLDHGLLLSLAPQPPKTNARGENARNVNGSEEERKEVEEHSLRGGRRQRRFSRSAVITSRRVDDLVRVASLPTTLPSVYVWRAAFASEPLSILLLPLHDNKQSISTSSVSPPRSRARLSFDRDHQKRWVT